MDSAPHPSFLQLICVSGLSASFRLVGGYKGTCSRNAFVRLHAQKGLNLHGQKPTRYLAPHFRRSYRIYTGRFDRSQAIQSFQDRSPDLNFWSQVWRVGPEAQIGKKPYAQPV